MWGGGEDIFPRRNLGLFPREVGNFMLLAFWVSSCHSICGHDLISTTNSFGIVTKLLSKLRTRFRTSIGSNEYWNQLLSLKILYYLTVIYGNKKWNQLKKGNKRAKFGSRFSFSFLGSKQKIFQLELLINLCISQRGNYSCKSSHRQVQENGTMCVIHMLVRTIHQRPWSTFIFFFLLYRKKKYYLLRFLLESRK